MIASLEKNPANPGTPASEARPIVIVTNVTGNAFRNRAAAGVPAQYDERRAADLMQQHTGAEEQQALERGVGDAGGRAQRAGRPPYPGRARRT